jgi:hypothetical protein
MKIKEFSIMQYGPLKSTGKISLNNFNLFYGKNEDGKTLTIDTLVKLLLGKKSKDFEQIDRVEESPTGYVKIVDDKGKEITLERGDLTKVVDITPSDYRNIFIIRNSDLFIDQESEVYTTITDRLTALRTVEISKIKEALRDIAKITPTGQYKDTEDQQLKTKISNARNLIDKNITNLFKEFKDKNFDQLELKLEELKKDQENIDNSINNYEDSRKRGEYEKGKNALDSLCDSLKKLNELNIYNEEEENSLMTLENDLKNYKSQLKKLTTEIDGKVTNCNQITNKFNDNKSDFSILDEKKKKLEGIIPDLNSYKSKIVELPKQEKINKFLTLIGIIFGILLSITIISWRSYILFSLFFIIFFISLIFKFKYTRNKGMLEGEFKKIKTELSKFELAGENIEKIFSNVQKFNDEYIKKNDLLKQSEKDYNECKGEIYRLQNKEIPEIEKEIKYKELEIEKLKGKSKVDSLEEYSNKLKQKVELETLKKEKIGVLKSHFGENKKSLEENISYWEKSIKKLEEYKDKALALEYNDDSVSELYNKKKENNKSLRELNSKIDEFKKDMEFIERTANDILTLEAEHFYCHTSKDVKAIENRLKEFIDYNETLKDSVKDAIKIFEKIESEEKEKVSDLFGKNSKISNLFNKITDGLYEEVTFMTDTNNIMVTRKDKTQLEAKKLSGGAYDQLYLSIRLALGEKLLKGKKGFFIMDDPFIKSDSDRLKKQIDTLKMISEDGWQILYFSAKKEIKDALEKDVEKGDIKYIDVEWVYS